VIVRMLERLGCDVTVCTDGRGALEQARARAFDVVLMDCQMPAMDGYEAARAIRDLGGARGSVPIVAVTAHALPGDEARALEAGMDDYVTKPVPRERLVATLVRWLGRAARAT